MIEIIDVDQDPSGTCYLVEELLDGEDLWAFLHGRPDRRLDLAEARAFLGPIIDAVALAHERGVVHRDLKPENVFLVRSGKGRALQAKLIDFGIAYAVDMRLTRPGDQPANTLCFTPPEVFNAGYQTTARTDVWALGVMLFEVLSGKNPFVETNDQSLPEPVQSGLVGDRLRHFDPEDPARLDPTGIAPEVMRVVRRCLSLDPMARYENARDLLGALNPVWRESGQSQSLHLSGGETAAQLRSRIQRDPSSVRSLYFNASGHSIEEIFEILALGELAELEELRISGTKAAGVGRWDFPALPLLRLELENLRMDAPTRAAILSGLLGVQLQELSIEDAFGIEAATVIASSQQLARLKWLRLSCTAAGDDGLERIAGSSCLHSLERLTLTACEVHDRGAGAIGSTTSLPRLVDLDLSCNMIGPAGVESLEKGDLFPRLRRLDLSNNTRCSDAGARALARSQRATSLTRLALAGCAIHDEGARAIAGSSQLAALRELDLANNEIGDEGTLALADSRYLFALQSLKIGNNPIRSAKQRLRDRFGSIITG